MPHVSVTIAGRAYRMACDEGQENHLLGLGQQLDAKIDQLRSSFGEIGDMRLAVMAGIMVADELAEAQRNIASLRTEIDQLQQARAIAVEQEEQTKAHVSGVLNEAASRVEKLVSALAGSGV